MMSMTSAQHCISKFRHHINTANNIETSEKIDISLMRVHVPKKYTTVLAALYSNILFLQAFSEKDIHISLISETYTVLLMLGILPFSSLFSLSFLLFSGYPVFLVADNGFWVETEDLEEMRIKNTENKRKRQRCDLLRHRNFFNAIIK